MFDGHFGFGANNEGDSIRYFKESCSENCKRIRKEQTQLAANIRLITSRVTLAVDTRSYQPTYDKSEMCKVGHTEHS